MLTPIVALAALATITSGSQVLRPRQDCGLAYELCAPTGATQPTLPTVGPELSELYTSLIQTINSKSSTRSLANVHAIVVTKEQLPDSLCCEKTSQCLLLPGYNVPFCWDRFTTNFYFSDGSYGSVVAGNYTSASGTRLNLIYGDWESQDGTKGNIYANTPTMIPDTSTLPMPTLWTSSGVGTAVPASELGSSVATTMNTTHAPTITRSAITLPSTTISVDTLACTHCNITIVPGLTGLPPQVTPFISGSTFPVTTSTRNGTDTPSTITTIRIVPATVLNHASGSANAYCMLIIVLMLSMWELV